MRPTYKLIFPQKIDHLPYRGFLRKKIAYAMAVLAINVRRVLKYTQEGT